MEAYYDVRTPGSYGGVNALYRTMKSKDKSITKKQIVDWLATQDAYTLHKPIRRRFVRRKIYVRNIDYLWQADLVDMSHFADSNDGFRFLLTVIDVLSKYAWVQPLKRKDSKSIIDAFDLIFGERRPQKLQTDKGKEFVNAAFQNKLKDYGVQFYTSENEDVKASVVERFNRTLKTKMWKYFTHRNTYKYVDVIQDMVHSYNHTYHRTIGRSPASVNKDNETTVLKRMYGDEVPTTISPRLRPGDKVRISKTRHTFDKGYLPNWTEEIFTVSEVARTSPPTYVLEDYDGEKLQGSFYDKELQRIIKTDDVYKIEKIIRSRRRQGIKEYFVKWRGYPEKFNSWVKESDVGDSI
jgi:transposase InsO family protein